MMTMNQEGGDVLSCDTYIILRILRTHVSSLGVPMKKKFHPDFFNEYL